MLPLFSIKEHQKSKFLSLPLYGQVRTIIIDKRKEDEEETLSMGEHEASINRRVNHGIGIQREVDKERDTSMGEQSVHVVREGDRGWYN